MAKSSLALFAFNRGIVSKRAQARVDLERVALSADQMTNWRPETLGPMALRVGTGYLLNSGVHLPRYLPFVFAVDDAALVEMTDGQVKIVVDDAYLTFEDVVATVTNGDMDPNLDNWTDADDSGATSEFDSDAGALVALSSRVIVDVAPAAGTARASYKVDGDGSVYTKRTVLDSDTYQEVMGEWLLSGAAGDYDVRVTVLVGSVSGSATGEWLDSGSDREWYVERAVTTGQTTASILVEKRLSGSTESLASATIGFGATVLDSGGGGLEP